MGKSAESADESYNKAQRYANEADNSLEEMNTLHCFVLLLKFD